MGTIAPDSFGLLMAALTSVLPTLGMLFLFCFVFFYLIPGLEKFRPLPSSFPIILWIALTLLGRDPMWRSHQLPSISTPIILWGAGVITTG